MTLDMDILLEQTRKLLSDACILASVNATQAIMMQAAYQNSEVQRVELQRQLDELRASATDAAS